MFAVNPKASLFSVFRRYCNSYSQSKQCFHLYFMPDWLSCISFRKSCMVKCLVLFALISRLLIFRNAYIKTPVCLCSASFLSFFFFFLFEKLFSRPLQQHISWCVSDLLKCAGGLSVCYWSILLFCTVTERTWFDCILLLVMPCITIMWQIKKPWTLETLGRCFFEIWVLYCLSFHLIDPSVSFFLSVPSQIAVW